MSYYLLNRLSLFNELGLALVMDFLKKYRPKTDEESLEIMNVVDGYLKHNSSVVVIVALHYFLHLVENMPHLKNEVYSRAKPQILHFIKSGNPELSYMLLEFVESILEDQKDQLQNNVFVFYCKYNEPLYVKKKKIDLLPKLISPETVSDVLDELSMYCSDVNHVLSEHTIKALGKIATLGSELFSKCIEKLLDLINLGIDYVTSNVLFVLQDLDFGEEDELLGKVVKVLPKCLDDISDDKGRCALLWLLGEYGQLLEPAPYILEDFIDQSSEEINISVQHHLLTATMKLFFKRPAECQEILGKLFENCAASQDIDLRDRAGYFYQLLQTDVSKARNVICNLAV